MSQCGLFNFDKLHIMVGGLNSYDFVKIKFQLVRSCPGPYQAESPRLSVLHFMFADCWTGGLLDNFLFSDLGRRGWGGGRYSASHCLVFIFEISIYM